ncbi:MAG: arsenate reductase ArsC [Candidatus Eisenbacteria bacterium]|nr:arsenate reductase ArsC [Candidatus Eisenbacteria bacterium]
MAEGWTRHLRPGEFEPFSAGLEPTRLDARAAAVMAEAGVDITDQSSKSAEHYAGEQFDCVITVCDGAREQCPHFPGAAKRVHAGFADPPFLARDAGSEEEALEHYRRVRDEIRAFVEGMSGAPVEPDPKQ